MRAEISRLEFEGAVAEDNLQLLQVNKYLEVTCVIGLQDRLQTVTQFEYSTNQDEINVERLRGRILNSATEKVSHNIPAYMNGISCRFKS